MQNAVGGETLDVGRTAGRCAGCAWGAECCGGGVASVLTSEEVERWGGGDGAELVRAYSFGCCEGKGEDYKGGEERKHGR